MLGSGIIPWLITYRYFAIFPLAVLEGPIVSVFCGFLLHFNYFDFWPLYLVLVLGDLVGDIIWYGIGYFGAKPLIHRYGHMVNLTEENMARIEKVFKRHQNKTILFSKMSMGMGFALVTLTTAGAIRIPFLNYVALNTLGGFFWSGILLAIGYFFGNLYLAIDRGFRIAFLVMVACLFIAALFGFKRYVKNRVIQDTI
jgi:membrane protein DedA with SNARE-associated domain